MMAHMVPIYIYIYSYIYIYVSKNENIMCIYIYIERDGVKGKPREAVVPGVGGSGTQYVL